MKAYKEYMDKISVSDTLHKKLVSVRPIQICSLCEHY